MMIFHDSRNALYRFPMGAVACSTTVTIRLHTSGVKSVALRVWWDNRELIYPMEPADGDMFEIMLEMPEDPGLLWYYFRAVDDDGNLWYFGNAADGLGGAGQMTREQPQSYQITVYRKDYETPEWMRNSTMMQIMLDRFCSSGEKDIRNLPAGSFYHVNWDEDPVLICNDRRGDYVDNDYFGGNLRGLREKLPYLHDMGIRVVYLNPIFKAHSTHKYNTGDYMQIDPSFGNEQEFSELCAEAKAMGIRIILDGVFSHSGSDSIYFNRNKTYGEGGAYNDKNSPYVQWYMFKKWPDDYTSWWGFNTLPNFDKNNPDYRRYIVNSEDSVVAHWLKAGSSGWRLDVADELPMDLLAQIRTREKQVDPDAALIGEVWEDPSNKIAYGKLRCYCTGDTLDATMNYPLRDAVLLFLRCQIDAGRFVRRLESMRENLPKQFMYSQMNLLGSHDKPRALAVLAEVGNMEPERRFRQAFDMEKSAYAKGKRRLIAAWRLICALPGMPCVYYGDDAGLYGMADPFCRGTYPWGHEDKDLVREHRSAIRKRNASRALRTGNLSLEAVGTDVVLVIREITGGKDAFGKPAKDEKKVLAVNRCTEKRWVEFAGKTYELKPESATWLK